jgi:hypothetical protein
MTIVVWDECVPPVPRNLEGGSTIITEDSQETYSCAGEKDIQVWVFSNHSPLHERQASGIEDIALLSFVTHINGEPDKATDVLYLRGADTLFDAVDVYNSAAIRRDLPQMARDTNSDKLCNFRRVCVTQPYPQVPQ